MRVGIDIAILAGAKTGVETYIARLIEALARSDRAHRYYLYAQAPAPELDTPGECVMKAGGGWLRSDMWRQTWLPREIARDRIDVFHSPFPAYPLLIKCPLVVTLYDLCWRAVPEGYGLGERCSQRWWLDRAVRRARRLICISKSTARDVVNLYPRSASKIDVIHAAIDDRYRAPPDEDRLASLKERLGIAKPFILSVGTIAPRKNLGRLVQAFARLLADRGPQLQLVVAGRPGWRSRDVTETCRRLDMKGEIIFTGYVHDDDLHALYAGARMFVLNSLYEGFGLPLLEAMAGRTPVVASRASSLPEVVGGSGILVDPYDVEALADAMWLVHTDEALRRHLIAQGERRVSAFSWDRAASETLDVFARAAARG